MHDVLVSIGSNQGRRIHYLHQAVIELAKLTEQQVVYSPVYETEPVGFVDQPKFLNMVVRLQVQHRPLELLAELMRIELSNHRQRTVRFGPRTLDLDILLYDNEVISFRHLTVPHPRMWERAFVLVPLADLIPHRRGLSGKTIRELASDAVSKGDVSYVGRFW